MFFELTQGDRKKISRSLKHEGLSSFFAAAQGNNDPSPPTLELCIDRPTDDAASIEVTATEISQVGASSADCVSLSAVVSVPTTALVGSYQLQWRITSSDGSLVCTLPACDPDCLEICPKVSEDPTSNREA